MAFIRVIGEDAATGRLRREYDAAIGRAGKVFNVVKIQGVRPRVLRSGIALYSQIMHGESELSRAEREMLAVVVSQENGCHY
ncbi:MAG TPA: carboxymuconolactone decarboxylase family protein [Acidobacteriota bacterium]|nr:carboxymuconolactone decarboxylase family protein [Acidobacteriota bacterium]